LEITQSRSQLTNDQQNFDNNKIIKLMIKLIKQNENETLFGAKDIQDTSNNFINHFPV